MINKIIVDTVKKMIDSGLSNEAILSALEDLGVNEKEKKEIIALAKGEKISEPIESEKAEAEPESAEEHEEEFDAEVEESIHPKEEEHELIAEKAARKIKMHLDDREVASEFRETSAHVAIDSQTKLLEHQNELLESISKKIKMSSPMGMSQRLADIERELKEIKAAQNALQSLLKQLLDSTRKVYSKLK